MSLILAVEPDRRQSAHLAHIVRQSVGAELILAETTELALASIGNRVPDLILVPALLSPQDDAALAAALRVIASAAHVQMVTTPIFASAKPESRARGVLSAFRRSKAKAAPDGCDPAEFAQQISSYLQSAAEERAVAQFAEPPVITPVTRPHAPVESSDRYVPLGPGQLYRDEHAVVDVLKARPAEPIEEPVVEPLPEPIEEVVEATGVEPVQPLEAESLELETTSLTEDVIEDVAVLDAVHVAEEMPFVEAASVPDVTEMAEAPDVVEAPELVETAAVEMPVELAAEAIEEEPVVEVVSESDVEPVEDLSELIVDESVPMLELVVDNDRAEDDAIDLSSDFDALGTMDVTTQLEALVPSEDTQPETFEIAAIEEEPAIEIEEEPVVEPVAPHLQVIHVDAIQEFAASVEAMTATETTADMTAAPAQPFGFDDFFAPREPVEPSPLGAWRSWTALEGITAEPPDAPVPAHVVERAVERTERPDWVQLVESLRLDVERRRGDRPPVAAAATRPSPSRPVQDEWGLFDPAQCGFAALLAKLDEITHTGDSRPRPSA